MVPKKQAGVTVVIFHKASSLQTKINQKRPSSLCIDAGKTLLEAITTVGIYDQMLAHPIL
jgi:hypothetical protein